MPTDTDELNAFKKTMAEQAATVYTSLADLQQHSPTFNADKQHVLNQLAKFQAYKPADAPKEEKPEDDAESNNAKNNAVQSQTNPVKEGQTLDAHPEIVKPESEKAEDRPENTDTTPQVQKDAAVTEQPKVPTGDGTVKE